MQRLRVVFPLPYKDRGTVVCIAYWCCDSAVHLQAVHSARLVPSCCQLKSPALPLLHSFCRVLQPERCHTEEDTTEEGSTGEDTTTMEGEVGGTITTTMAGGDTTTTTTTTMGLAGGVDGAGAGAGAGDGGLMDMLATIGEQLLCFLFWFVVLCLHLAKCTVTLYDAIEALYYSNGSITFCTLQQESPNLQWSEFYFLFFHTQNCSACSLQVPARPFLPKLGCLYRDGHSRHVHHLAERVSLRPLP